MSAPPSSAKSAKERLREKREERERLRQLQRQQQLQQPHQLEAGNSSADEGAARGAALVTNEPTAAANTTTTTTTTTTAAAAAAAATASITTTTGTRTKRRRKEKGQAGQGDSGALDLDHSEAWAEFQGLRPEDVVRLDANGNPVDDAAEEAVAAADDAAAAAAAADAPGSVNVEGRASISAAQQQQQQAVPGYRSRARRGRKNRVDASVVFIEDESGFKQVTKGRLERRRKRRNVASQLARHNAHRIPFDSWLDRVCTIALQMASALSATWLLAGVYIVGALSSSVVQDFFGAIATGYGAVSYVLCGLALAHALDRYETRSIVAGEFFTQWWMVSAILAQITALIVTIVAAGDELAFFASASQANVDQWRLLNIVRASAACVGWAALSMDYYAEFAANALDRHRINRVTFIDNTSNNSSSKEKAAPRGTVVETEA